MNGSDLIVYEGGEELITSFIITNTFITTIEVQNQTIIDSWYVIVVIDKIIVPGPCWLVIQLNNNGSLGSMLGRRTQALRHGINVNLNVDITANADIRNNSSFLNVFAHIHVDNKPYGIFEKATDPHLFSAAFNDLIIGNE